MAASLPSLDQFTEARAEDYLPDSQYQSQSYQFATRSNGAQGGVALPQGYGSFQTLLDVITAQTWSDASRRHGDTSTPYIEHSGTLSEKHERVQSIPGVELDFGISEATTSRHVYQEDYGDARPGSDRQLNLLTFPEGEADAVTITASDLEGLQPTRFLSNNIIDFYIKYLERSLSPQERNRFYFFNSFFFTRLLGSNSTATDINECEVDYNRVRKWTGEVNLFEKDYIFIPILRSAHWSLIIICHLSTVTSSADKRMGSRCILHLDPLEGIHKSFEGHVRRYLYRACRDQYQASNEKDDMLEALACNTKYIRAQVPRQDNSYDCGVYVLHYVEDFIRESISPDFSIVTSEGDPCFTNPYFAQEVSSKREFIHNLICDLSKNPQERAARSMDIEPKPRPRAKDVQSSRPQPPKRQSKPSLSKKWNEKETSVLLNRLLEGGRIRKGIKGPTHWDLISEDIHTKCETIRSEDECRRRFDTLLKAYRKIEKTGKSFGDITKAERAELNLATPLTEEWYRDIDRICNASPGNAKSRKRPKLDPNDGNGMLSSRPPNPTPPPVPSQLPKLEKPSRKQVAIAGFRTLDEDLRSTILNLFHASSLKYWQGYNIDCFSCPRIFELEELCQWLAIVQDQRLLKIREFIFQLSLLKLVSFGIEDVWRDDGMPCLKLSNLLVYKKFLEKVLCKNPDFDIYSQERDDYDSVSFPKVPIVSFTQLRRIRVLSLYRCRNLECADLSEFPKLRSLAIKECDELKSVTGWEVVKELGWLEISECRFYEDFPHVQSLPSLRQLRLEDNGSSALQVIPVPDLSQCVRLWRLEIWGSDSSALNSVDLSNLRFLEVLRFRFCSALTTIQGLSGLQSLTRLDLSGCRALRRVPELGCLKALTHLDISESGIQEIPEVQELHLLTILVLWGCSSLKTLPWLGHLKALAYLHIRECVVEEIPGVEDLVSLETLDCWGSRLKGLPDLRHLPRLREVCVKNTPLTTMEPSSLYYGKKYLKYSSNGIAERMGFVDEISDVSDMEYNHSDDDGEDQRFFFGR